MNLPELERLLQPAIGYLQLGMMEEANEEIEALPPSPANTNCRFSAAIPISTMLPDLPESGGERTGNFN